MPFTVKTKGTSAGSPSSPEPLYYTAWASPIGPIYAAATPFGLCRMALGEIKEQHFVQTLQERYGTRPIRSETPFRAFRQELEQYFLGTLRSFSSPIEFPHGTPFEQKVWRTIMRIPYGETRSYQWVARQIGRPQAYRGVGRACGRNPLSIVIPCHRVITKSGGLGGYTGGVSLKRRLLALEGAFIRGT